MLRQPFSLELAFSPSSEFIHEVRDSICYTFATPQVATILLASFDTTSIRVSFDLDYLQIKLTDYDEFLMIVAWMLCGVVMAVISIVLALPAAYQVTWACFHPITLCVSIPPPPPPPPFLTLFGLPSRYWQPPPLYHHR